MQPFAANAVSDIKPNQMQQIAEAAVKLLIWFPLLLSPQFKVASV